jgi:hypothetical protein
MDDNDGEPSDIGEEEEDIMIDDEDDDAHGNSSGTPSDDSMLDLDSEGMAREDLSEESGLLDGIQGIIDEQVRSFCKKQASIYRLRKRWKKSLSLGQSNSKT